MAMLLKKLEDANSSKTNWERNNSFDKIYNLITGFTAFHKFGEWLKLMENGQA